MTPIVKKLIDPSSRDPWGDIAREISAWLTQVRQPARDVTVLVPLAPHLPMARAAWAQQAPAESWMPRFETAQTLALALGASPTMQAGQLTMDVAVDRLAAAALLAPTMARNAWARRDAPGHALAVAQLTETAHQLTRVARCLPPMQRERYFASARQVLADVATGLPGQSERLLAQVALEWAALAPAAVTDVLFEHDSGAWVLIEAGGPDHLARSLLRQAGQQGRWSLLLQTDVAMNAAMDVVYDKPTLTADADASVWQFFGAVGDDEGLTPCGLSAAAAAQVQETPCEDFETEAQCAAAQVLRHVQTGEVPVLLVAQDRLLVRRVRALLSRQDVRLADETGWTLSTTRAAALVVSVLRLLDVDVSADDLLDALKSFATPLGRAGKLSVQAVTALESAWRRHGWRRPQAVNPAQLPERAASLWQQVQALIDQAQVGQARSMGEWLQLLDELMRSLGMDAALQEDEAGRQVLQLLHPEMVGVAVGPMRLGLSAFRAWLDDVLEQASFIPSPPVDAEVVITPLGRAMLRPFAAVVFPGADERHLGAWSPSVGLLEPAQARAMGLPSSQVHRQTEWWAFCHLLWRPGGSSTAPRITLLHRTSDQGEMLEVSPFVVSWRACRAQVAHTMSDSKVLPTVKDPRVAETVTFMPLAPPQPAAPALLPPHLSASSCEALRQCPYRFFALHMLQLRAADELDEEIVKRDYGTWLHEVLLRFHQHRAEQGTASMEIEAAVLARMANEVLVVHGFEGADFLPYAATFRRFVPRYLHWLHQRDAQGAVWLEGERSLRAQPPEWAGVGMLGHIDRVDSVQGDEGVQTQLIDYKTGSSTGLRQKVKQPLEDTQLAFYAALMVQQSDALGALSAAYLALDDGDGISLIEHVGVVESAEALLQGVAHDLQRLRAWVPMLALGSGAVCETCDARGVCRRDQWSSLSSLSSPSLPASPRAAVWPGGEGGEP